MMDCLDLLEGKRNWPEQSRNVCFGLFGIDIFDKKESTDIPNAGPVEEGFTDLIQDFGEEQLKLIRRAIREQRELDPLILRQLGFKISRREVDNPRVRKLEQKLANTPKFIGGESASGRDEVGPKIGPDGQLSEGGPRRINPEFQRLTKLLKTVPETKTKRQVGFSKDTKQQLRAEDRLRTQEAKRALQSGASRDAILAEQQQLLAGKGPAIDRVNAIIDRLRDDALASGESDISRFRDESLTSIREELAPSLGLRPSDTPNIDRGGEIAEESIRQQGQLVRGLNQTANQARLEFPLQLFDKQQTSLQLQESIAQFQQQLAESARINRISLASGLTAPGIALAGSGASAAASGLSSKTSSRLGQPTTKTSDPLKEVEVFSEAAGSIIGGFAGGSSRTIKDSAGPVDEQAILAALLTLPVESYTYIGEEREHIGTFAEDFQKAFGIGDGKTINYLDAIGTLIAAVKALAAKGE